MGTEIENEWHEYNVLSLPPHCVSLAVEVETIDEYQDGRTNRQVRTARAYYDSYLGQFHDAWGTLRGEVLHWRLMTANGV